MRLYGMVWYGSQCFVVCVADGARRVRLEQSYQCCRHRHCLYSEYVTAVQPTSSSSCTPSLHCTVLLMDSTCDSQVTIAPVCEHGLYAVQAVEYVIIMSMTAVLQAIYIIEGD